jgi:hypothetical protein
MRIDTAVRSANIMRKRERERGGERERESMVSFLLGQQKPRSDRDSVTTLNSHSLKRVTTIAADTQNHESDGTGSREEAFAVRSNFRATPRNDRKCQKASRDVSQKSATRKSQHRHC